MESVADAQSPEASKVPQTTIDLLPYEVLHRIIAFVPKKVRTKCALVNSIFHAIVCELDELDKIIRFKYEHFSDESIFDSIIATRRRFNKVYLYLTKNNINKVPVLLQVHGESIKAMRLQISNDHQVEGEEIFAIFKSLPNLEKLALFFYTASISNCQVPDEFTILPNLKHLKLSFDGEKRFGNLFDFIPENTITHLEIKRCVWNGLENLMERQAKSIVNLKISAKLFNSPEMYQKMKLKTLTIIESYDDSNSAVDINLLQIISDHPELEGINFGKYFEPRGDVAEALLKLKHLKSIDLTVTHDNWDKVLHEVGRSQIENIHLDFMACDEGKLRIFFNQQYSNIKSVKFKHSINETTEVCNNWKGLTKICLNDSYEKQQVNLNFILDNLPNLEILECYHNDSIFIPNGNTYPKIKRIAGTFTTLIDLLNALPNLDNIFTPDCPFDIEILRKMATMNISKFHIKFKNNAVTLTATEEVLMLLDVIFRKAFYAVLFSITTELQALGRAIENYFRAVDYELDIGFNRNAFSVCKIEKVLSDFPFD